MCCEYLSVHTDCCVLLAAGGRCKFVMLVSRCIVGVAQSSSLSVCLVVCSPSQTVFDLLNLFVCVVACLKRL